MLVCYTDPSFKSTTSNDYKACRLWGKIGKELHLIDCYVRQDTVSGMVRWLYDLYERTRDTAAVQFFMEANFMQDVILDEFEAEGESAWIPTAHHAGQTKETGQAPAHRSGVTIMGTRFRILQ